MPSRFAPPEKFTNTAFAAAVTGNARNHLHKLLLHLHPSQPIYGDTDSICFVCDPEKSYHKDLRSAQGRTEAENEGIEFGDFLGQWEFEVEDDVKKKLKKRIVSVACAAKKLYSMKIEVRNEVTNEVTYEYKRSNKGISFTRHNMEKVTFESVEALATGKRQFVEAKNASIRQTSRGTHPEMESFEQHRKIRKVCKRQDDEIDPTSRFTYPACSTHD